MAHTWTVGKQTPTNVATAAGGFTLGWNVPVVLDNGVTFDLKVANADYTPDKVRALIEQTVAQYSAVADLSG